MRFYVVDIYNFSSFIEDRVFKVVWEKERSFCRRRDIWGIVEWIRVCTGRRIWKDGEDGIGEDSEVWDVRDYEGF